MEDGDLKAELSERARELGFVRIGVARADALQVEGERQRAFVAAGRHGDMSWLADTVEVRIDPRHPRMLPTARSVVVLVSPYARDDAFVGLSPGRVARYARGRDYHNVLLKRLRKLATLLRERGHATRASTDSMPVFERAWAQRAGVGFVGKNCCLIVPGLGSHVFLSTLITSAELPADEPMSERCGECRSCLDACPTGAFAGPRELDSRKCISYLTIETRGSVPEPLRPRIGDWIFGCDACQDPCPFNRTAPAAPDLTAPYASTGRLDEVDAAALLTMTAAEHADRTQGSPLRRPGPDALARNAALVIGNRGEQRHLPVLRRAAREHESETVREAATWAHTRLATRAGRG